MSFDTFPSATLSLHPPLLSPHPHPCWSLLPSSGQREAESTTDGSEPHEQSDYYESVCMCVRTEGVWELGARGVNVQWQLWELRLQPTQRLPQLWRRKKEISAPLGNIYKRRSDVVQCRMSVPPPDTEPTEKQTASNSFSDELQEEMQEGDPKVCWVPLQINHRHT